VLSWKPSDHGYQCAHARVPLNYRDPGGATISIALISHRATGPGPNRGWLFFNGGGPNPQVATMPAFYPELPAAWREQYNVITWDPRGMGGSTQLRCFPTEAAENALLGHDSSADIARDLNLIRAAVGDPVLNYYGASCATLFGAVYANLFPAATGRMVLDGNLNPVAWSTGGGQLPSFTRLGSPQASGASMAAFLRRCGQAATSACAFSAGTPARTTAKWDTLLGLVGAAVSYTVTGVLPAPGTVCPQGITPFPAS
jgi:pimeloyl-ACP methyl ester carboxylesterase